MSKPADWDADSFADVIDIDDDNDGYSDTGETNMGTDPYDPLSEPSKQVHNLLLQTTFGPTEKEEAELLSLGVEGWIDAQLNAPSAYDEPYTDANPNHKTYFERFIEMARVLDPVYYGYNDATIAEYTKPRASMYDTSVEVMTSGPAVFKTLWFETVLHAPDQLRQRVAYALSQILVMGGTKQGAATYYDILAKNAFTNYRDLLIDVSLSSSMCNALTYLGSRGDKETIQPDENYARELMQLFTIGLHRMNMDGSPMYASGELIPTYDGDDVEALARVFTGWGRMYEGGSCGAGYARTKTDLTRPICQIKNGAWHDNGDKEVTLSGQGTQVITGGDATQEMIDVIDMLMAHPNMAPFISKHLIMRLVKSNPTPGYVGRVAAVFNDNGSGVKGDLKAVVRAILLDTEAITIDATVAKKAKEPILAYTQFLRAFDVNKTPLYYSGQLYRFKSDFQGNLGQGPLSSPTVFNYYDNAFVPVDDYFRNNDLVSPEIQIIDEQGITYMANKVYEIAYDFEKNSHTIANGSRPKDRFEISYDREYALVLAAVNNDINNFAFDEYQAKAVDAVMPYLDKKLTGGTLSQAQKDAIKA
ncbi:MAG: DUF1800 family protein, partial [Chloroflexota bacterium]